VAPPSGSSAAKNNELTLSELSDMPQADPCLREKMGVAETNDD
jgi:hypothetical protein